MPSSAAAVIAWATQALEIISIIATGGGTMRRCNRAR